jgi:hypothetical protein
MYSIGGYNALFIFKVLLVGDPYWYDCRASTARDWLSDNIQSIKEDFIMEVDHGINWSRTNTTFYFKNHDLATEFALRFL